MNIFLLLGSAVTSASTITVGSNGVSTIQGAIDIASSNDIISIPSGSYAECLTVASHLQNFSFSASGTVTIDATACSDAAVILNGSSVHFQDFVFENTGGRAFWIDGGTLNLTNATISDVGSSSLDGGAIYLSSGTLAINSGSFTNNSGDKGAVIYAENSAVSISDAVLSNNSGDYGGGIYMTFSSLDAQNNTFEDNVSGFNGGAVVLRYESTFSDNGSLYEGNLSSGGKGGAVYAEDGFNNSGSSITLSQVQFVDNSAGSNFGQSYSGGAVYMSDKIDALLSDVVFRQNIGRKGGAMAIYGVDGQVQLSNTTFDSNSVSSGGQYGGAIWAPASGSSKAVDLHIDSCVFEDNSALGFGGAIRIGGETTNSAHGSLTVNNSTFSGNDADSSASGQGGAISIHVSPSDPVSISNTVFSSNESELDGAALFIGQSGDAIISGCTFTANSGSGQANSYDRHGGAVYAYGASSLNVNNSLFVSNVSALTNTSNPLNRTTRGGALHAEAIAGAVEIVNSVFVENQSDDFGGAIGVESVGSYLIQNNSFAGNASAQGGCAIITDSTGSFSNNICSHSSGSALYAADATSAGGDVDYNDWFANADGDAGGDFSFSTTTNGNISDDPMFVAYTQDGDYTNDDLHLQSNSPAIDAGTGFDLDGSTADMGAFGGSTFVDGDGDGYGPLSDCDDANPNAYPGAAFQDSTTQCMQDSDGDGFGDALPSGLAIAAGTDCDDSNAAINSAALEICDNVDNNCNGLIDDSPIGGQDAFQDLDSDGFGDPLNGGSYCTPPAGYVGNSDDCNDIDPSVNPNASETPGDEVDQNCDGLEDCFRDLDGDGQGGSQVATGFDLDCADFGEALTDEDCDDSDPSTYVGAAELDSTTACMTDSDEDGYGDFFASSPISFGSDCNDQDPQVYMGATEIVGDGIDQDCDNSERCYDDLDGDGYGSDNVVVSNDTDCSDVGEASVAGDCDDGDANVFPGAEEIQDDGIDQDCDGEDQTSSPDDTGEDDSGGEDTGDTDTGDQDTGDSTDSGGDQSNDTSLDPDSFLEGDTEGSKEAGCTCSSSGQSSSTGVFGALFIMGLAFLRRRANGLM